MPEIKEEAKSMPIYARVVKPTTGNVCRYCNIFWHPDMEEYVGGTYECRAAEPVIGRHAGFSLHAFDKRVCTWIFCPHWLAYVPTSAGVAGKVAHLDAVKAPVYVVDDALKARAKAVADSVDDMVRKRAQRFVGDHERTKELLRRAATFLGPLNLSYHTVAEQREAREIVQAVLKLLGRDKDDAGKPKEDQKQEDRKWIPGIAFPVETFRVGDCQPATPLPGKNAPTQVGDRYQVYRSAEDRVVVLAVSAVDDHRVYFTDGTYAPHAWLANNPHVAKLGKVV